MMKETFQFYKSILNIRVFAMILLLCILTAQKSAVAENYTPIPKTGQTHSCASGDDGDLQKGVPWPDPRFTDNGNGTVTDHLTGLIWLKNADCFGIEDWWQALVDSNNLANRQCGLNDGSSPGDWRLPNVRELFSLIKHRWYSSDALPDGPFTGAQIDFYWTSTGGGVIPPDYEEFAWAIEMRHGHVNLELPSQAYYVWPVRDIKIIKTVIDIKPGSYPNSINLRSKGKVSVAILTTDNFNAYDIDPATCEFASACPIRWNIADVDHDGDYDMLFHFMTQELDLNKDSIEATVKCETFEGIQIIGTKSVNITPKGNMHSK